MSELVTTTRNNAMDTRPSTRIGGEPIEGLRRDGVPPARRLYEGIGSVKRLSSSALRGKRIISGPFGEEVSSHALATGAADSANTSDLAPQTDRGSGNGVENRQLSDGEAEKRKDAADYLDFLSSEFMARLHSAGDAHERRRRSQWKRDFEYALDKRKRKQARSDEFFEIYRRTHGIESAAANFNDYFLLEAAYDVDFDDELHRMFPTSLRGRYSAEEGPSSVPTTRPHLVGGEGSPLDLGRLKHDFAGIEDNTLVHGDSSHPLPSAPSVVPESETGTHSSASTDEGGAAEGDDRGLDGNDGKSMRALVDDDDIDRELDDVTKAASASIGGNKSLDDIEMAGRSIGTARTVAGRGRVLGNSDRVTKGSSMGPKGDLRRAGNDGESCSNKRQQEGYRSRRSKLARKSFACPGDDDIDDVAGDLRKHASERGELDRSDCSSTELTLGRPDPTSVHWKFSRRLLQTRTTPMALTETVEGGVELSLPHQSLGDTYIELISEVVKDLPGVTRLDLRDNRLTDVGVQEIVQAICSMDGHRGIQVLDLSENKLDTVSAKSLCTFLKSPTCCLREILLAKADIDDAETAIVMEAMQFNHSVRYLDFSDNAIGGGYEKTQRLAGGPTTGGASISLALGVNTTLRRIDLQWNLLGSKSGVLLGSALAHNHTLEWLDVSYNAIGEEGAQAIGTGLAVNDGLVRLDLSYNEISSRGVLVIAQALEDNDRLEVLRLDGNNIGFDGGRTLIRSLNYWSLSRTLGLKHCMLESRARTGDCFDPLYPTGKYTLDCSRPYQKAVAYELLRSASTRPGSSVRSLVVRDNLSDKKGVDVKVVRPGGGVDLWTMLGRQQQDQHQQGQSRPGSEHSGKCGSRHGPTCPFATMDAVEWQFKLKEAWVIDASTGNRFYPPDKGFLEVDFLCHPLPPTGWALINASGMQHLQALAEGDEQCRDQPLLYLKMAAKDLFFSSAQVNEILRNNAKKLDSLQVHELMTALISRLYNPGCLHGLLEMHLEPRQIHIIQKNFGHAFAAFTTCVGGHYSLDLSRELDREAAIRLSEWSHLDQMCLRVLSSWAGESGGTSQKGRWSSFRNERYRKRPFTRGITEGFFKLGLTDRVPGVLEFDFVSIARPSSDTPPLTPGQFDRFVTQCGLARLMAELPSPLAKSSTSAGGLGADDDGVVNAMMGISLGDAVRLKLASDTSEKLRASTANATHILQIEERRRALAASAESFGLSDDDCDWGDIPSPFASPRASVASVKSQAGRVFGKQRGGGGIGGAGAGQDASTRESTAAARRRSLASQLARQRLKKAARYAGAGLAVAPPFAARVSLGERSLEEALSRGGVDWKRWENGKLSALWRHLLAKDCALMEIAPPLLIAHIVRVRVCHGTEDKTLEKRSPADAPLAEEPGPWLSRGFLGRLVKTKGTRPGQDPKRVATSLVLDTFRDFLSNEADVWLVKRETLESKASSLCPDAPSIRKNTIEHIFDAYVDKLPDHDFGRSVPVSREATATTPIDVSAEPGVNPKAAHQESDAEDVCKGPSPPSFPRGKLSDSSRATSGFGRSRREMSRVADETSSGDDLGRGLNGAAVAEDDNNGNNADRDCGNSGGGDCESMRPAFAWVASHEGDAGPHTAVLAQKAEWAVVARDVRFRLANAWLSCDQAKILASIFPERAKGITTNPREDLVVELFGRVTDVDNFSVVLGTLDGEAQLSVGRRLGWLNVLNPHQIDRRYDLDLRHSDHRRVARVLSDMAVAEPGPNLQNQRFSRHADPARHFFIPGWEVPQTWPAAAARGIGGGYGGVPDDGHFAVEYCSDEAIGCKANPEIRERLRAEAFLCGVASDRGLGVFGYMDEDLAKTLAELPSL
eukprot:g11210.t1